VLHRDLKPENVLVASFDPDSCVCGKLSVFNTSRFLAEDVSLTKKRGGSSPIYMAPEIHDGKHFISASDVYSFALTMWSIWAQKEPYSDQASSPQIYQLIINGERLTVPSDIPEPLADLTRDCWSQNPEDRPKFASIVERLEKIFNQLPPDENNFAPMATPSSTTTTTTTTTTATE